jgi:hypothetical protein
MTANKPRKKTISSYGRFGIMLAGIGAILAIDTMADLSVLYKLWPVLCTILGIGFIGIYLQRSRREASYMGIGLFIIGFSGLAIYCNFTSWSVLATCWPAFIVLMGIAMISGFIFGNRRPPILLTGLLFISLGVVFFMVFSLNHRLWWSIFIFAGCSFLIFDRVRRT